MATKVLTYPPAVIVSGNEALLGAQVTDAYVSLGTDTRGRLSISAYHLVGDTITLSWNGIVAVFTCVAATSFTGVVGTYPVRTTETLWQWVTKVKDALLLDHRVLNDFKVDSRTLYINFEPYVHDPVYNLTITVNSTASYYIINSAYTSDVLYENYRLRIQLMQEDVGGTSFTPKTKYRSPVTIPFLYSGVNAALQYDLKRLLYSDLTGHFTFPESGYRHLHDILRAYYPHLSFLSDNAAAESLPMDHFIYVLPGRVSKTKEKALNTQGTSIYDDLLSSKRFLTYAPVIKYTDIYAPEKLYFLFMAAGTNHVLRITERFASDAAETRTLLTFSPEAYTLHEFSVGYQQWKQADYGTKVLTEFEVWIEDQYGTLVSERRTFIMDFTYVRSARYFLFKNSFGMYELFRSTGNAVKANKTEKEFYNRVVHGMVDTDQLRKPAAINQTYGMRVNSGYIVSPWNFYLVHEFLGSDDVYWLKNDRAYAVQIESSDVDISKADLDNLHEFDFDVTIDDLDDSFFDQFDPGSELPVLGDFSDDFSDDFYN